MDFLLDFSYENLHNANYQMKASKLHTLTLNTVFYIHIVQLLLYLNLECLPFPLQVEVCTEFACLKSAATEGTTAESPPSGMSVPSLVVQDAYTVSISWNPPQQPNGIILRYDLMKRVTVDCDRLGRIASDS